jgi:homogentisate phytyltransferase/homogentisate geranylgeranyltransferase
LNENTKIASSLLMQDLGLRLHAMPMISTEPLLLHQIASFRQPLAFSFWTHLSFGLRFFSANQCQSIKSSIHTRKMQLVIWTLAIQLVLGWGFHQHTTTISLRASPNIVANSPLATNNNNLSGPHHIMASCRRSSSVLQLTSTTVVPAAAEQDDTSKPPLPLVLWRFTRPHTIIGSALAIPALHLLAAPTYAAAFSRRSLTSMVFAMVPALLMNLYITGLNQVTDVEIDKINKPDLPIAAGDLSLRNGIITVVISLLLSLGMGISHPIYSTQGLSMALWFSGILGTMYSLEPIRLKRHPFLAAFCIVAVRGAVINAGFFAHAKAAAFGASTTVLECLTTDVRCIWSSLYFAVFGVVIALMKDVPDVKGDAISNVRTFSVRLGQKRVFGVMHRLLTTLLVGVGVSFFRGAIVGAANASPTVTVGGRILVGVSSLLAGGSVQREAAPVDPEDPKQVYKFYMHLWKLFYLSYLVLPMAR